MHIRKGEGMEQYIWVHVLHVGSNNYLGNFEFVMSHTKERHVSAHFSLVHVPTAIYILLAAGICTPLTGISAPSKTSSLVKISKQSCRCTRVEILEYLVE